jgi:hypothetical protein
MRLPALIPAVFPTITGLEGAGLTTLLKAVAAAQVLSELFGREVHVLFRLQMCG